MGDQSRMIQLEMLQPQDGPWVYANWQDCHAEPTLSYNHGSARSRGLASTTRNQFYRWIGAIYTRQKRSATHA